MTFPLFGDRRPRDRRCGGAGLCLTPAIDRYLDRLSGARKTPAPVLASAE